MQFAPLNENIILGIFHKDQVEDESLTMQTM